MLGGSPETKEERLFTYQMREDMDRICIVCEECTSRELEPFPQSKLPEDAMKEMLIKLKLDLRHVAKLKQFKIFVI